AFLAEAEHIGSSVREINHAILRHRAAVVHADHHRPVIAKVGNAKQRSKRKGAVRAGEGVLIEWLTAGSGFALEEMAIPRGHAKLIPVMADLVLRCRRGCRVGMVSGCSGLCACDADHNGESGTDDPES